MHDGKALQSATSHNFGDGFAKAFGIQYTNKDNKLEYVHQTSWGMTTRIIGAMIMVHGDDSGLVPVSYTHLSFAYLAHIFKKPYIAVSITVGQQHMLITATQFLGKC